MFKEIYRKSIELAGHKRSKFFLGFISFIESFIFPIPPDVFIIPMTIAKRTRWVRIALIATIGSVLGACLGYFIGYVFFNEIGVKIFELYGVDNANFLKEKMSSEGGVIAWLTLLATARVPRSASFKNGWSWAVCTTSSPPVGEAVSALLLTPLPYGSS